MSIKVKVINPNNLTYQEAIDLASTTRDPQQLNILARSPYSGVRDTVLSNENTSYETVRSLCDDADPSIAYHAHLRCSYMRQHP